MNLIADKVFRSVLELTPELLKGYGIRLVLADLDNTLAPYSQPLPSDEIIEWKERLLAAGIRLFIVSNNRSGRPERYCGALGVDCIAPAGKPSPRSLLKAVEQCGVRKEEAVMVGDQVFTDVFAGKRAGIRVFIIRPVDLSNPFRCIRYALEQPFIRKARKRSGVPKHGENGKIKGN